MKWFTFKKSDNLEDSFIITVMDDQTSQNSFSGHSWMSIELNSLTALKTVPQQNESMGSRQFILLNTQSNGYTIDYSHSLDLSKDFWKMMQSLKIK